MWLVRPLSVGGGDVKLLTVQGATIGLLAPLAAPLVLLGGSLGVVSPAAVYYGQRNLEWTWIKNTPGRLLLTTAIPHAIYSLAGVLHYIRQGRSGPVLRAKLDALRALPAVLADRRRVQSGRRVEIGDLVRWMEPRWLIAKRREKAFIASRRS